MTPDSTTNPLLIVQLGSCKNDARRRGSVVGGGAARMGDTHPTELDRATEAVRREFGPGVIHFMPGGWRWL
jgi:hypothetical protein